MWNGVWECTQCKYKVVSIWIVKNQNATFLLMQNDLGADFKNLKSAIQSFLKLLAKIKCGILRIAVWYYLLVILLPPSGGWKFYWVYISEPACPLDSTWHFHIQWPVSGVDQIQAKWHRFSLIWTSYIKRDTWLPNNLLSILSNEIEKNILKLEIFRASYEETDSSE